MNEQHFYIKVGTFEGFRSRPYLCPAGVLTIGYGHTANVKPTDTLTLQQAQDLLKKDMELLVHQLRHLHPRLAEHQIYALADFCYNLGMTYYKKSTLRLLVDGYCSVDATMPELKRSYMDRIASKFLEYCKYRKDGKLVESNGLKLRRAFESTLFQTSHIY